MLASVIATAQNLGGLRKLLESVRSADERRMALEARLGLLERYLVPERELPGDVARATREQVKGIQRATAFLQGLAGENRFLLEASRFDTPPTQKAVDDLAFACKAIGLDRPPYLDQALVEARKTLGANAVGGHATILCRYRAVKKEKLEALTQFQIFEIDCDLRAGVDQDLAGWVRRLPEEAVPASLDAAVDVLTKVKAPKVVLLVTEDATAPDGWLVVSGKHAIAWAGAVDADRAWHATAATAPQVREVGKEPSILVEKGSVPVEIKFTRTGRGADLTGTAFLQVTRSDVVLKSILWVSPTRQDGNGWLEKGKKKWTKHGEWTNHEGRLFLNNPTPLTRGSVQFIGEMNFTVTLEGETATVSMSCQVPQDKKKGKIEMGWVNVYEITMTEKPKPVRLPDDRDGLEFPAEGVVVL